MAQVSGRESQRVEQVCYRRRQVFGTQLIQFALGEQVIGVAARFNSALAGCSGMKRRSQDHNYSENAAASSSPA